MIIRIDVQNNQGYRDSTVVNVEVNKNKHFHLRQFIHYTANYKPFYFEQYNEF